MTPERPSTRTRTAAPSPTYPQIWAVVRRIPPGRVLNYGAVARLAGLPGRARQVGYAMYALPAGTAVPWHRVVNAQGGISRRARSASELTQRMLLEQEGVRFGRGGKLDLERYLWTPRTRSRR
ncbi:MAG: MGMT family protein [Gemmatimonadales bacterium]